MVPGGDVAMTVAGVTGGLTMLMALATCIGCLHHRCMNRKRFKKGLPKLPRPGLLCCGPGRYAMDDVTTITEKVLEEGGLKDVLGGLTGALNGTALQPAAATLAGAPTDTVGNVTDAVQDATSNPIGAVQNVTSDPAGTVQDAVTNPSATDQGVASNPAETAPDATAPVTGATKGGNKGLGGRTSSLGLKRK